jgi:hypothetical protein
LSNVEPLGAEAVARAAGPLKLEEAECAYAFICGTEEGMGGAGDAARDRETEVEVGGRNVVVVAPFGTGEGEKARADSGSVAEKSSRGADRRELLRLSCVAP